MRAVLASAEGEEVTVYIRGGPTVVGLLYLTEAGVALIDEKEKRIYLISIAEIACASLPLLDATRTLVSADES